MKEHTTLMKKRAAVFVVLIVIFSLGVWLGHHFHAKELEGANNLITQLRAYNAGRPHTETPAELMGLHDQTNYTQLTETNFVTSVYAIYVTNTVEQIEKKNRVFNEDAINRIKSGLIGFTNFQVSIWCDKDDADSLALSSQIKTIYEEAGFYNIEPIKHLAWTGGWSDGVKGLLICANPFTYQQNISPFQQIFNELQIPLRRDIEGTNFVNYEILYIVGPQP